MYHPKMRDILWYALCLSLTLSLSSATIDVYDYFGRKVDSFETREFNDDFVPLEGFLVSSEPQDACYHVTPPSFLTNFTMGKFLLINGSSTCSFTAKIRNAEKAGYDAAIIYDPSPLPFLYSHYLVPIPRLEINIEVVFVSFADGISLRENYVYNNSFKFNYRIEIKPTAPDITYYMYLFGAVIGICFFVMLLFVICMCVKCIQERRRSLRNRLTSRQLKQIPTAKFSKGDPYDACAICLEDFNEGEKLRILPCSHAYHIKCIDPWLRNNRRNCPLCKRKITFGDSEDETDSEDSELTSPAENTPLLSSPSNNRTASWGTFSNESVSDVSGPLSVPECSSRTSPFSLAAIKISGFPFKMPSPGANSIEVVVHSDEESLLPPPHHSVNNNNHQQVSNTDESGPSHADC